MVNTLNCLFQLLGILCRHILHNDHGESSHSELIYHDILPLYCLQALRQITEQIIIDPCRYQADHRRDQEQHTDRYHNHLMFCNPFAKLYHFQSLLMPF